MRFGYGANAIIAVGRGLQHFVRHGPYQLLMAVDSAVLYGGREGDGNAMLENCGNLPKAV